MLYKAFKVSAQQLQLNTAQKTAQLEGYKGGARQFLRELAADLVQKNGTIRSGYLRVANNAGQINIKAGHYLRQALVITLFNPKAILFYMAFFPLFVDPKTHLGLISFGAMAATIAGLTFLYGAAMTLLTYYLAERMRANPLIGRVLEKLAGIFLVGFGIKLAISK